MSGGKPTSGLFGKALAKAKKLSRIANFNRNKEIDATSTSSVSNLTSTISSASSFQCPQNDVGTSPSNVIRGNVIANGEQSPGSPFLGFEPQNSRLPQRLPLRKFSIFAQSTPDLSSYGSPFEGFSPQQDLKLKRKSVDLTPHPIYEKDIPMTPISTKRRSVDYSIEVITPQIGAVTSATVTRQSFFKIVLGDFCQFSSVFPQPHGQCAAMAATALAFNVIKPIDEWDNRDLNNILHMGQVYYKECADNLLLTDPQSVHPNGFLEVMHLNKNLYIRSEIIELSIDLEECRGGPHDTVENMAAAFRHFESKNFTNGILTYKDYSYAILRYRNSVDNSYVYVFFDSHGRCEDGARVIKNYNDDGGKSAILFFNNANALINFFLREWPLLPPSTNYRLSQNLILVPLRFPTAENAPALPHHDHTEIQAPAENTFHNSNFRIVCGDYCETDLPRRASPSHQCSGIIIFSFLYSTLHSAMSWNAEHLSAILDFGNMFYQKRYELQIEHNSQYDPQTIMYPRQLAGYITYEEFEYKIDVSELNYFGRIDKEHLLNGFQHLENLECPFGMININDLSYGIITCVIENATVYIFFDSHGRTVTGEPNGPHSVAIYFNDIDGIIDFIYSQFGFSTGFDLFPVQYFKRPVALSTNETSQLAAQNTSVEVENVNTVKKDTIVEFHNFDKFDFIHEPFYEIVFASEIESDSNFARHSHCIAMSISAIFYAFLDGMENWQESHLDDIYEKAILYHSFCNEEAIEKGINLPLTKVGNFIHAFSSDDRHFTMSVEGYATGPPRSEIHFTGFERALRYFYLSVTHKFAILSICEKTYGVCKCVESGKILFYDPHGRNVEGRQGGNLSAAIYFLTYGQFVAFLKSENEEMYLFSLEYVSFVQDIVENTVEPNLCARVVSGTFSQNNIRFSDKSRNTQCTANSVVFLAFAFVIENQWTCADVDAILELGDYIYTVSYGEAIRLRPRRHSFLAAHEVRQVILVNVARFDRGVVNVHCKPMPEKEYSGNLGRFGQVYMERFFEIYSNGVFICDSLSVALHKFQGEYILFDPHARSTDGQRQSDGTANIFFFHNISALFQFLCIYGYNMENEFTLTPFTVTDVDKRLNSGRRMIAAPSHRPGPIVEISDVSMDDIPLRQSDNWVSSDDVPLNRLVKRSEDIWDTSEEIPLIRFVQKKFNFSPVSPATSIKSMPVVESKTLSGRKRDIKRNKVKNEKQKKTFELYTQEEQALRRRWNNYVLKVRRTHTPNVFGDIDNFREFCEAHDNDDSDEEMIQAADAAIEDFLRVEQTRQLQILNNARHPSHFLAFGNHEEIDESDEMYALFELSAMDQKCDYCGAFYFKEERNSKGQFRTCCNFGEIHSELPQHMADNYPQLLRNLLLRQTPMSKEFMDNIMLYNNVLSFASLGATTMHNMQARGSLGPVLAMEGMIYHVAEHFHTNSTGVDMPTAQLYYINNSMAVTERITRAGVTLNRSLLLQLENFMRQNNPLADAYRMLKDVLDEVHRRPNAANAEIHLQIVRNREQIRIRQNHGGDFGVPTSNEVAVVYTHQPSAASKNIIIFPVDDAPEEGIPLESHNPNRDAMLYPILFPYSEQTWSYNLLRRTKAEIAQLNEEQDVQEVAVEEQPADEQATDQQPTDQQVADEELPDEPDDDGREGQRKKPRVRITVREFFCFILMIRMAFSPLLNAGKLGQQFIIDAYARAQENTFEYLESERGQNQIRSETYGALKDYLDRKKVFQPDLPGKLIVMPNDIVGSRQYMKKRYADALSIVAKYGKPTFFITMTCNPMWKEITRSIPAGANPVDRPDVVARVFKAKVDELIHDISKKKILGNCVAYLAVIEWQKRSLPHCHLVTFNSAEDRPATHVDIDKFVSAEIPDRQKNKRLYEYVTTYMYHHRCDDTRKKETCRVPKKGNFSCPRHPKAGEEEDKDRTKKCVCYECSKHFPRKFSDKSELIEGGYPIYRRRQNNREFVSSRGHKINNQWIVPYNPYLLLKYNCHINVEITSSLKSIKYLFKYLHKGLDMARLNIKLIDNVQVYNEFEHFVDCRYLSAGEAIWRLFDFPIFYQSHSIYALPVHLENYQNVIFHPDNPSAALTHADSMLTGYFELNRSDSNARNYLYTEIPNHYVFESKPKRWKPRKQRGDRTLGRLYIVNYNNIELYSLRLLLLTVRGAESFEHIRNVNGIQYDTFRQAASALGLLEDDSLLIQTFEEIIDVEMPYRIRCLFANMLLFNTPTDPVAIWDLYKKRMFEDYTRRGKSDEVAENLALRHISFLLEAAGKSNTEFMLPESTFAPINFNAAHSTQDTFDDDALIIQADAAVEGQRLAGMLNVDQRCIFDEIMDSVAHLDDRDKQRLFFVDGPGGTGKTFLFSSLIDILRGMGLSVLPIAWTGIAASLLKGGLTAHSTFKLPLNMTGPVGCHLSTTSDLADQIRKATVIVWDEISMTLCYALDAVDAFFQDLMGNSLPFGGKIFIATGDFRQILPVVKGGSKFDLLNVTVKKTNVWPLLQKRSLTINVRLTDPNDLAFAQLLLDIGEGKINDFPGNEYFNSYVKVPSECIEPVSILDRIYGRTFSSATVENYSKYGIMTTLNEDVNLLNKEIYKRLTEDVPTEQIFYSTDSVIGLDPNDDDAYDVSMLNSMEPPNLPPHVLKLKVNCVIMLLCNLNPALGLCNGTRLTVTKIYKTCIRAKIINGAFKDEEVLLSRCRLNTDSIDMSCKLQRVQIPVKLGFAMTINKAQGQSFDFAGVYLRKPPFSHGQLYVALSRARSKDKLIIQVLPDVFMGKLIPGSDDVFVPNIVYKEIF